MPDDTLLTPGLAQLGHVCFALLVLSISTIFSLIFAPYLTPYLPEYPTFFVWPIIFERRQAALTLFCSFNDCTQTNETISCTSPKQFAALNKTYSAAEGVGLVQQSASQLCNQVLLDMQHYAAIGITYL
jgi:hypothetical protein